MSKKWITILVAAVIGALLLPSAAFAACRLQVVDSLAYTDSAGGTSNGADPQPFIAGDKIVLITPTVDAGAGLTVNFEGVSERVADLLITDDNSGVNFCFTSGNDLVITYNAIMTLPTTPGSLNIPGNLDIFDSNGIGGVTVTSATVSQVFAANTTNSQLDVHIGQAGTPGDLLAGPAGSAIRVKNIRVNASLTAGAAATISATFLGNFGVVATVQPTLAAAGTIGTIVQGGLGAGVQSSNAGLFSPQTIAVTEGFGGSFRHAGGTCASRTTASDTCYSQVANDIATVATSLTFSVTGIPSGVTVTFPSTISMSAATNSINSLTFAARSATLTNTGAPGALVVTYDNSNKSGENLAANTVTIGTADNADKGTKAGASSSNPNCTSTGGDVNSAGTVAAGATCNTNPKIGVKVGTISLAGTANLYWNFGRADVGTSPAFTGDDVAADATVIPRYGLVRDIIKNKAFFTIFPTRTTLLFPFVSTVGGFNSGISIINSGADAGAFGATSTSVQLGGVTLFFFGVNPSTGAAVTDNVNSDLTNGGTNISAACRGLDANGHVLSGTGMACSVAALLPLLPSKPAGFDGYVIAVTGFNYAHGFSAQFNAGGAPFGANPALIVGLNGSTTRDGGGGKIEALGN